MHEGLALSVAKSGICEGKHSAKETAVYLEDMFQVGHGVNAVVQVLVNLPWFLRKSTMQILTKNLAINSPGDLRDLQNALETIAKS